MGARGKAANSNALTHPPTHSLTRSLAYYLGAEIAGLCRSAMSFALERETNPNDMMKRPDISKIKVGRADFDRALKEVGPRSDNWIFFLVLLFRTVG